MKKRGPYKLSIKRVLNSNISKIKKTERNIIKRIEKEYKNYTKTEVKKAIKAAVKGIKNKNEDKIRFFEDLKKVLPDYKITKQLPDKVNLWYKNIISLELNKTGERLSQESNFTYGFLKALEKKDIDTANISDMYYLFGDFSMDEIMEFATFITDSYKDDDKPIVFFYDFMNKNNIEDIIESMYEWKTNPSKANAFKKIKSYIKV